MRLAPLALLLGAVPASGHFLPLSKLAPPGEVASIAKELALPPTRPGEEAPRLDRMAFPADALKGYAADLSADEIMRLPDRFRFRVAVLKAFGTVREAWVMPAVVAAVPKGKKDRKEVKEPVAPFRTAVPAALTESLKQVVRDQQVFPAVGIVKLERALRELEAVAELRAKEPKRWQAHHDYALAAIHTRAAFLHEYDLMLGHVLREDLPELDAAKHAGWRLAPAAKMGSKKDVQALARRGRELFEKLAADHPGTPWAVLARRELDAMPGLKWEPRPKE